MPKITFLMDAIETEVPMDARMLDVCREMGSSIPFGCANGVCGTCMVKIVDGNDTLSSLDSIREKQTLEMFGAQEDYRLACQCIVQGDASIDNP